MEYSFYENMAGKISITADHESVGSAGHRQL